MSSPIPTNNIQEVHIYDKNGNITKTIVFQGSIIEYTPSNIAKYPKISKQSIHWDDSIRVIKNKIWKELENISYKEIYLFSAIKQPINPMLTIQSYKEIPLNEAKTKQILRNLGIDYSEYHFPEDPTQYTFDILKEFVAKAAPIGTAVSTLGIPIGQKFEKSQDISFQVNPLELLESPEIQKQNPFFSFENSVLLNYFPNHLDTDPRPPLYVCLARDVLETTKIDPVAILQVYYPLLYQDGIRNSTDLLSREQQLLEETRQNFTENTWKLYETVDIFYDIYRQRKQELPYMENGIKSFWITIKSDIIRILHLDTIFKKIHATATIPFIKYNPGFRRENIYRLYSEKMSTNGKKIPVLSYGEILKLSKETGKTGQITMYYRGSELQMYINFQKDGDIRVKILPQSPINPAEIPTIIQQYLTPEMEKLKELLYDTGYKMTWVYTPDSIGEIEYISNLTISKPIDLVKYRSCISALFDIISLDIVEGAKLRFKRVENYEEMDTVGLLIYNEYNRTHEIEDVIHVLMTTADLKFTEEQAREHVIQFFGEHTMIRGKLIEHAGFPVTIQLDRKTNRMDIRIVDIHQIQYVNILHTYIDSILRIFQAPETTSYPISNLNTICGTTVDYKEIDKPRIENIVVAEPQKLAAVLPQPILFQEMDEEFFMGSPKENEIEAKMEGELSDIDDFAFMDIDSREQTPENSKESTNSASIGEPVLPKPVIESPISESASIGEPVLPKESQKEKKKKTPEEEDDDAFFGMDIEGGAIMEQKIEGRNLKNPNPFQEKIETYDPALILKQEQGKYSPYSRVCPPAVMRQPVLLTEEEKTNIDQNHPGSYSNAIQYGSDPNKQYWYICPRYWSFKTNSSLSEEEVAEILKTQPNAIIPPKSRVIPKGAFIYEFNAPKEHLDEKGNYITHYPGYIRGKHPNGYNLPCCFKRPQSIEPKQDIVIEKGSNYVIASNSYPIPKLRWGFLPQQIQTFLGIDNKQCVEKTNQALIKKGVDCLLRYGVEQIENQSFLGIFTDIYTSSHGLKQTPTVKEFRKILKDGVDLDSFIKYHNGSLIRIFTPPPSAAVVPSSKTITKYQKTSMFLKNLQKSKHPEAKVLMTEVIMAYENFIQYLGEEDIYIDHTYLWDIISQPNPKLIPQGLNLVIMEIPKQNIVEIICPTSSYSPRPFDSSKETLFILKQGEFYEPIYMFSTKGSKTQITRTFSGTKIPSMTNILKFVEKTMRYNCKPHNSLPGIYDFQRPYSAKKMLEVLHEINYHAYHQVMNSHAKIVGWIISREQDAPESKKFFIPCSPSGLLENYPWIFLDHVSEWKDYMSTIEFLKELKTNSEGRIKCSPKVKILDDNKIIGILTETNQYIRIFPISENPDSIDQDLEELEANDFIKADRTIMETRTQDSTRLLTIQNIRMESKQYRIFRNIVRELLSHYENRLYKIQIIDMLENLAYSYDQKLGKLVNILRQVVQNNIQFEDIEDIDDSKTTLMANYKACFETTKCQMILPKKNRMMDIENENLYYSRLADELLRFHQIRNFVLEPMYFLNLASVDYNIDPTEVVLLESILKSENLDDLRIFNFHDYIQNISYEIAEPSQISQKYSNIVNFS